MGQVKGVGEVSLMGSALPAVRIDLQPLKLAQYGISLDTVREAIANSTTNKPKGILQGSQQSWVVDSNGQLDKAAQYQDLIVSYKDGKAVRLHDVATVYDSVEDQYQAGFLNSQPSVMVGIKRQAGANMLDTIDAIKAQLPALEKDLPADTQLKVVVDRSPTVRESLYDTEETLLIAMLLVIAVVFVFLRNVQAW